MLDTDTCIYAMSAAPGFQPALPLQDCAISVVVLGELEFGVLRSHHVQRNRTALEHWLAARAGAGHRFGRWSVLREDSGRVDDQRQFDRPQRLVDRRPRALLQGVPLISHNLREFRRVQGLLVETWMHAGRDADADENVPLS